MSLQTDPDEVISTTDKYSYFLTEIGFTCMLLIKTLIKTYSFCFNNNFFIFSVLYPILLESSLKNFYVNFKLMFVYRCLCWLPEKKKKIEMEKLVLVGKYFTLIRFPILFYFSQSIENC